MEITALGSLPREQFRLAKSSSLIIGEAVGNEAGVTGRIALGLTAATVGGGEGLVAIVCLRATIIPNGG